MKIEEAKIIISSFFPPVRSFHSNINMEISDSWKLEIHGSKIVKLKPIMDER